MRLKENSQRNIDLNDGCTCPRWCEECPVHSREKPALHDNAQPLLVSWKNRLAQHIGRRYLRVVQGAI